MAQILLIGDREIVHDWKALLVEHHCSTLTLEQLSELASHSMHRNGGSMLTRPPVPDFVFESFGTLEDKIAAIEMLPEFISEETVVVTNVIPATATEVGEWLEDYPRVIGSCVLPSLLGQLPRLELARTPHTVDEAVRRVQTLLTEAGKGIEWVEDRVGLIGVRVLAMIVNEAAYAVMEQVATPDDIDRAMRLGTNYPKGPLAWGDEIGLDYIVLTLEALFEEYHDDRYRPCVLLKQMVRAGKLGKREGGGFFEYVL